MAKGAPDYTAKTDVVLQTLSELIVRNRYGTLKVREINTLAPSGWETEINVAGKGIIYGGWMAFDNSSAYLRQTVDGGPAVSFSFALLLGYSLDKTAIPFFYLLKYDDVKRQYVVGLSPGVTFDVSYKLERYIHVPYTTVRAQIFYALL